MSAESSRHFLSRIVFHDRYSRFLGSAYDTELSPLRLTIENLGGMVLWDIPVRVGR